MVVTNRKKSRRYVTIANKREVKYLVIVYLFDKEFIYDTPHCLDATILLQFIREVDNSIQ